MIVAEYEGYEGLLDWVKQKLGIGYVKLKTYTDLNLLKEHQAILNGLGIRNYVKCEQVVCALYVEKEKADEALKAIAKVTTPIVPRTTTTPVPSLALGLVKNLPLLLLAVAIPVGILIYKRVAK